MRFLLDECVDTRLLSHLQNQGHDVTAVARDYPASITDVQVLGIAFSERQVLITNDRGIGALVFVEQQPPAGVIVFRLGPDAEFSLKIERLEHVITCYAPRLDQI